MRAPESAVARPSRLPDPLRPRLTPHRHRANLSRISPGNGIIQTRLRQRAVTPFAPELYARGSVDKIVAFDYFSRLNLLVGKSWRV